MKDGGDIFSVGCGSGLFEMLLEKEFNISVKQGIEPSAGMAEIARTRGMKVIIATA
jgi:trans-aconitate methyltransferase